MKLGKEALGIGALVMALSGGCSNRGAALTGIFAAHSRMEREAETANSQTGVRATTEPFPPAPYGPLLSNTYGSSTILRGTPTSVGVNVRFVGYTGYTSLTLSVLTSDGEYVTAFTPEGNREKAERAANIIQSEISDSDDELIELRGRNRRYNDTYVFIITSLRANNRRIDF